MGTIPEWARAMRQPNTEVKKLGKYYYLYEVHCVYDKETKKRKHGPSKYLGRLVEGVGLVPKGTKREPVIPASVTPSANVEYGVSATAPMLLSKEVDQLRELFPNCWQSILGMAYCRLVFQCPLKDMGQHWQRSYLSQMLPGTSMSADFLSSMIREIGQRRDLIDGYFRSFQTVGDTIIFDGSDIESASQKMTDVRLSKTKAGDFGMVLNIMMAFSLGLNSPLYYRIVRGNIKDIKSFSLCLAESGIKDAMIIVDKGFFSQGNIDLMDKEGIQYIMPLRRDSDLIDYGKAGVDYLEDGGEAFRFNGREIFAYRQKLDDGHNIDLIIDKDMRFKESEDFMKRIHENEKRAPERRDPRYTWEEFRKRRSRMGTIAFITNAGLTMAVKAENGKTDKKPATSSFVYKTYKKRNCIEEEIDVFKNRLEADRTYMQCKDAEEGWMFANFIALQWYYALLRKLSETSLDSSFSVRTVTDLLLDVRKVKIGESWVGDCLTGKEAKAVGALGINLAELAKLIP